MPLRERRSVNIEFDWKRRNNGTGASLNGQPGQNLFYDRSSWLLLLANGVTTILAVTQN